MKSKSCLRNDGFKIAVAVEENEQVVTSLFVSFFSCLVHRATFLPFFFRLPRRFESCFAQEQSIFGFNELPPD